VSSVSIYNSALVKLDTDTISAFSDSNKAARLGNVLYDLKRKQLLEAHYWNFATKKASFSKLSSTPEYDFSAEFSLPSDFIRMRRLQYPNIRYKIIGATIQAAADTLKGEYIYDVTDTSLFSPTFRETLSYLLASEVAGPLLHSRSKAEEMERKYLDMLREARFIDGSQGTRDNLYSDEFIESRITGDTEVGAVSIRDIG
jgi:hypothetical protein